MKLFCLLAKTINFFAIEYLRKLQNFKNSPSAEVKIVKNTENVKIPQCEYTANFNPRENLSP